MCTGTTIPVRQPNLITTRSADLAAKVDNPDKYAGPHPQVPDFQPWPDPVGGFKIRHYDMAKLYDPKGPRIQPRSYRSTNMTAAR